jgi:hypothetical protein
MTLLRAESFCGLHHEAYMVSLEINRTDRFKPPSTELQTCIFETFFNFAFTKSRALARSMTHKNHTMGFLLHPAMPYMISTASGAIILGFGLCNILYPRYAYTQMRLPSIPCDVAEWVVVEHLMVLSGINNLVIGAFIFAMMWFGPDFTYGSIMLGYGAITMSDAWLLRDVQVKNWVQYGYGGFMVVGGALDVWSAVGKRKARMCEEGQARE